MIKSVLFLALFFVSCGLRAQEFMEKIPLKEGKVDNIEVKGMVLSTLLQVYDENSASHLAGDVYLRVSNNNEAIADFYVDKDEVAREHYTKIYKNYFFTFDHENSTLIIEKAQLSRKFALSNIGTGMVEGKNDFMELQITDFIKESGYDAPLEEANSNYFSNVQYTVQVKVEDIVENLSFSSTDIKDDLTYNVAGYTIHILSDQYKDSLCYVEMKIENK